MALKPQTPPKTKSDLLDLSLTEPELPTPPQRRKKVQKQEENPYHNIQIDLFQTFVHNTLPERERLSNTIDIWDSVPRYSISRQEMNKRRDERGNLPLLNLSFVYHSQTCTVYIQPAKIREGNKTVDYYPSANEELVEDALRKIAAKQNQGFYEKPTARSGVAFSLYELREELATRGHTRSYQQILQSLAILQKSHIEIRLGEGKEESFVAANYLPAVAAVSRKRLEDDPDAKWLVQFHPLVARSIDQLTFRQFNYVTMMELPTQLARWIHKQLSMKFTFASFLGNPFEMRYSTIKRDSNLLNRTQERDNRCDVDNAFTRLIENLVLRDVKKEILTEAKGKVIEVVYQLYPTHEFVKEMKASNRR